MNPAESVSGSDGNGVFCEGAMFGVVSEDTLYSTLQRDRPLPCHPERSELASAGEGSRPFRADEIFRSARNDKGHGDGLHISPHRSAPGP